MKESKSSGNFVIIIAIAVIIILLFVIWNMQTQQVEDDDVSYVDLEELGELGDESGEVDTNEEEMTENDDETIDDEMVEEEVTEEEVTEEETPQEEEETAEETIEQTGMNTLTVTEGDLVSFPNLKVEDPDQDPIAFTFSAPLNKNGEWQTEKGDAGTYEVKIIASDGEESVTESVRIIVEPLNRPPVIQVASKIEVDEGDEVVLNPKITDPDNDDLTILYTGWMNTNRKKTTYSDSGEHIVRITAKDDQHTTTAEVTVVVNNVNRGPKFVRVV